MIPALLFVVLFDREYQAGIDAFNLAHYDEAAAHFRRARDASPRLPGPHRWLGRTLRVLERWDECVAASTQADLYAVVQAGLAALSGPLHGAASDRFEALVAEAALAGSAELALAERERRGEPVPGFGHPFYGAAGDPRARILLELAAVQGARSAELALATAIAAAMQREGRPPLNVDGAAVALRAALGLPRGAVAGLFALGRAAGWIAHGLEQVATGRLLRPRARYRGPGA